MVTLPLGQDRIAGGAGAAVGPVAQFVMRQPLKQDPPQRTVLGSPQAESTWSVSDLQASEQALREQLQLCNAWKTANDALGAAVRCTGDDPARHHLMVQSLKEMISWDLLSDHERLDIWWSRDNDEVRIRGNYNYGAQIALFGSTVYFATNNLA